MSSESVVSRKRMRSDADESSAVVFRRRTTEDHETEAVSGQEVRIDAKSFLEDTVNVYSNQALSRPYIVHKSLLFKQSKRSESSLAEYRLVLPFGPPIVRIFLAWLYSGRLVGSDSDLTKAMELTIRGGLTCVDQEPVEDKDFAELYILARKYNIRTLKNDVLTTLVLKHQSDGSHVEEEAVQAVLNEYGVNNPFVKYAIIDRAYAAWNCPDDLPDHLDKYQKPFLAALLKACATNAMHHSQGVVIGHPLDDICKFHEHVDDDEMKACRRKQIKLRVVGCSG